MVIFAVIITACNANAVSTTAPVSPIASQTSSPTAPPATPTRTPSPTPVASPTVPPGLVTQDIQYSGALSVEDLNTMILAIRAINGVQDAQGGVTDLIVTYNRDQVSLQKIIDVIKSFGYTVKE